MGAQLLGYFAVSAGRVMRLTVSEMHSALGLALMQASGTMRLVVDGDSPAKAIYAAFPNLAGVLSVMLSRQGLRAEYEAFEGTAGPVQVLTDDRGGPRLHRAALQVTATHNVEATAIDRVTVRGGGSIQPWCEPVMERRKPANAAAAANSIRRDQGASQS